MNARDQLTMQVLGLRQFVRDMPEHALVEVKKLLEQVEAELKRLCGD